MLNVRKFIVAITKYISWTLFENTLCSLDLCYFSFKIFPSAIKYAYLYFSVFKHFYNPCVIDYCVSVCYDETHDFAAGTRDLKTNVFTCGIQQWATTTCSWQETHGRPCVQKNWFAKCTTNGLWEGITWESIVCIQTTHIHAQICVYLPIWLYIYIAVILLQKTYAVNRNFDNKNTNDCFGKTTKIKRSKDKNAVCVHLRVCKETASHFYTFRLDN